MISMKLRGSSQKTRNEAGMDLTTVELVVRFTRISRLDAFFCRG
jgi:hypothetical protein